MKDDFIKGGITEISGDWSDKEERSLLFSLFSFDGGGGGKGRKGEGGREE